MNLLHSPQPPTLDAILMQLANEVIKLNKDFVIVFDDYHLIENKSVHDILIFLLESFSEKHFLEITPVKSQILEFGEEIEIL